jgi:hypothetical protein
MLLLALGLLLGSVAVFGYTAAGFLYINPGFRAWNQIGPFVVMPAFSLSIIVLAWRGYGWARYPKLLIALLEAGSAAWFYGGLMIKRPDLALDIMAGQNTALLLVFQAIDLLGMLLLFTKECRGWFRAQWQSRPNPLDRPFILSFGVFLGLPLFLFALAQALQTFGQRTGFNLRGYSAVLVSFFSSPFALVFGKSQSGFYNGNVPASWQGAAIVLGFYLLVALVLGVGLRRWRSGGRS